MDIGYRLNDRLHLIGGIRRQELDQDGVLGFGTSIGRGAWDITTTGLEGGVEVAASNRLVISAGLSSESRDIGDSAALDDDTFGGNLDTDRSGYFARLNYRVRSGVELTASIEDNDIDNAFALSTPTDSRRYSLRGRYRWSNGVALIANWRRNEHENARSAWSADTEQTSIHVSYATGNIDLSLGLGAIEISRNIEQLVTGGFRQDLYSIAYLADSDLYDASARWRLSERYTVGLGYYGYANGGSYPLDRDDLRAWLEIDLRDNYFVEVRLRSVDYNEDAYDDYTADLLELGFGLEW